MQPDKRSPIKLNMKTEKKKAYSKFFNILVSILVLGGMAVFIYRNRTNFTFLKNINYHYLIIIFSIACVLITMASFRYYLILKSVAVHTRFASCYKSFILGRLLNKIIPRSGGVYRAVYHKKTENVSYRNFISAYMSFVYLDIFIYMLVGLILVFIYNRRLSIRDIPIVYIFIAAIGCMVIFLVLAKYISTRTKTSYKNKIFEKIITNMKHIIEGLFLIFKHTKMLTVNALLILFGFFIHTILLFICYHSIQVVTTIPHLSLFVVLNKCLTLITITPGNLGIREFLYAFLAQSMAIGSAQGLSVALIVRISNFIILCVLSLVVILRERFMNKSDEGKCPPGPGRSK